MIGIGAITVPDTVVEDRGFVVEDTAHRLPAYVEKLSTVHEVTRFVTLYLVTTSLHSCCASEIPLHIILEVVESMVYDTPKVDAGLVSKNTIPAKYTSDKLISLLSVPLLQTVVVISRISLARIFPVALILFVIDRSYGSRYHTVTDAPILLSSPTILSPDNPPAHV